MLIGLQLNHILDRIAGRGVPELAGIALGIAGVLVAARFVWVFPATWLSRLIPAWRRHDPLPPWSHTTIIAWAGMRGVVSLAAALALPAAIPRARPADLPRLHRHPGDPGAAGDDPRMADMPAGGGAAAAPAWHRPGGSRGPPPDRRRRPRRNREPLEDPLEGAIAADLVPEFRDRAGHLHRTAVNQGAAVAERAARRRIRLAALEAARQRLTAHYRAGLLQEDGLVKLEQELDLEEIRIRQVLGDERTEAQKQADAERRKAAEAAGQSA